MTTKPKAPRSTSTSRKAPAAKREARGNHTARTSRRSKTDELLESVRRLEKLHQQTREQLTFIYGALEEIAERQQLQSGWQMDLARQFFLPEDRGGEQEVTVFTDLEAMRRLATEAHERNAALAAAAGRPEERTDEPSSPLVHPRVAAELAYVEDVLGAAEAAGTTLSDRNQERRRKGIELLRQQTGQGVPEGGGDEENVFIVPNKLELH